jgi:hypothetical protein
MLTREETLLVFRQSATGHLAALLAAALCEERIVLCTPEPSRMLHPLAVQMLRELNIDINELIVKRVGELAQRYREIIFIAEEGFTASSRIDLPKGRLCEWHIPAAYIRDESYDVQLVRARIVRDMLLSRLDQWCAKRCRAPARRHAKTA